MADSDGEYVHDASDDDYPGAKSSYGTRAHGPATKKRKTERVRKQQAWEKTTAAKTGLAYQEAADGTITHSVQEREEERKRKRLRKDTKPFQRGIIRHVALVLDLSEAMMEKDMRPNRFVAMVNYSQDYVREFFEQNPISQMSVLGMRDGICIRISELSGNPSDHITAIAALRNSNREPKGAPSLQNALEMARATLYHTPKHGTREVIIVFGALLTLDPGDISTTITRCVGDRVRVSIIGMAARLRICEDIVGRTNAGDKSEYTVATDQEALHELLLATTTPPVVRSSRSGATVSEDAAALMVMGFPSRVVDPVPTLCACHGVLSRSGYTCSRCEAKVCSLPSTCPSCHLTLLLSTHLARSYHHLFPLQNWKPVTWKRAQEKQSLQCLSCLTKFPDLPEDLDMSDQNEADASSGRKQSNGEDDGEELQKASESSRYECRTCESHFCIDCDMYCHMTLHNCPGCLSKADQTPEGQHDQDGDAKMDG